MVAEESFQHVVPSSVTSSVVSQSNSATSESEIQRFLISSLFFLTIFYPRINAHSFISIIRAPRVFLPVRAAFLGESDRSEFPDTTAHAEFGGRTKEIGHPLTGECSVVMTTTITLRNCMCPRSSPFLRCSFTVSRSSNPLPPILPQQPQLVFLFFLFGARDRSQRAPFSD